MRCRQLAVLGLGAALLGCPQDVRGLEDAGVARDSGSAPVDAGAAASDAGRPVCGDDHVDLGEVCDGTALGGATCETIGVGGGALACASDCQSFDLSGCQACTPACGARVCGEEPVCNSSCGVCATDEACTPDGRCVPTCELGDVRCTPDGVGFNGCGPNDALGVLDFGPRVACAGGGQCVEGARPPCTRLECAPADVMLLIDRSARISQDSVWSWMKETVSARIAMHDSAGRFGLVQFPEAQCAPGPVVPLAANASGSIEQSMSPPGPEASVPIAASLQAARAQFRSGIDAQAVLLVTAGDETCDTPQAATLAAARLFRMGVKVYVVGVTAQANMQLLDAVAMAGGTEQAYRADAHQELEDALTQAFMRMGACENRTSVVSAGYYHACRLAPDGRIDCWGRTTDARLMPPNVDYKQLAAGTDNACAVGTDDLVRCWGRNQRGQNDAPPGAFVQVSGGDSHFCGLRLGGELACWGYDDAGQASPPAGTFKQVTAGAFHGCAIRMDDTVQCWGGAVALSGTYLQIDGGGFGTCGVRTDGTLACTSGEDPPRGGFLQVSKGPSHACAISEDRTLACWGSNHLGQSDAPAGQFVSVAVNNEYACAVDTEEQVVCWGNGSNGQTSPP